MFSKNVRIIYMYLVCLITLFMVIGGIISAIYATAELIFPSYYLSTVYDKEYMGTEDNVIQNIEQIEKDNQEQINRQNNSNIRELIYSLAFVIVPLPIYIFSWRKIEKERKENESVGE